jgi:hypothetical protein
MNGGYMDFSKALQEIKAGKRLKRIGWNSQNQYIALHDEPNDEFQFLPFIYIKTVQDQFVPWLASQTDLLAEDWEYAEV